MITTLEAAQAYHARGWHSVPIPKGQKGPILKGWQNLRIAPEQLPEFYKHDSNVGLLLGEASNGLVDVDIDCVQALRLADWLPDTQMVHGRPGNPSSHRWYQITGQVPKGTTRFQAPKAAGQDKPTTIIELRSTGGQTVVPPSIHPSGEALVWDSQGAPGTVDSAALLQAVKKVAAAAVIAMHWGDGSRHDAAMALTGALHRASWSETQIEEFLRGVLFAAQDEEEEDRLVAMRSTLASAKKGQKTTGIPKLKSIIGDQPVELMTEWLGLEREASASAAPWEKPVLFDQARRTPVIPASVLPGAYAEMAQALTTTLQVPSALPVMTILSALSACLSTKFVVNPKPGWSEPVNTYTITALPPGSTKSAVLKKCMSPLQCWELGQQLALETPVRAHNSRRAAMEKHAATLWGIASREPDPVKRAKAEADAMNYEGTIPQPMFVPRLYGSNITPEQLRTQAFEQKGRFGVISDENVFPTLTGLYTNGEASHDIILNGIDGGRVQVDRKDRKEDIFPFLTFGLVVQPQVLRDIAAKKKFASGKGLMERFLYALPERVVEHRRFRVPSIPSGVESAYGQGLDRLLTKFTDKQHTVTLTLAPEAETLFEWWYDKVEHMKGPGAVFNDNKEYANKFAGYTLRLAGLMHVAEHEDTTTVISEETLVNAIRLATRLAKHAVAAFDEMNQSPAKDDAVKLAEKIVSEAPPIISRTWCFEKRRHNIDARRLDDALRVLADRGFIRQRATAPGYGRTPSEYDVNPNLLAQE